eukprot:TRINITY_DN21346_c2_g1_i2.p1 TRINITY_DN21346_c2_g1~~TRINITY_DN21346_c2_g1_i2.p1  ORF type:complete len:267 (-),score=37.13 TRINITY_DN21346_c2_g1_i2:377-1057(-)
MLSAISCLLLGVVVVAEVTVELTDKTSLIEVMSVAAAQASYHEVPGDAVTVENTKTSANPAAANHIISRKRLLPRFSFVDNDIDHNITEEKAKIEERRNFIHIEIYEEQKIKCRDLANDTCPHVDDIRNCGFCVTQKYPQIQGFGLPYFESDGVITPVKMCEGEFVFNGILCPTCEKAFQCLIVCSGVDADQSENTRFLSLLEGCFTDCGATVEDLVACEYILPSN